MQTTLQTGKLNIQNEELNISKAALCSRPECCVLMHSSSLNHEFASAHYIEAEPSL